MSFYRNPPLRSAYRGTYAARPQIDMAPVSDWMPALDKAKSIIGDLNDKQRSIVEDMTRFQARKGALSVRQVELLTKFATEHAERQQQITTQFPNIYGAIQHARTNGNLQQPRMTFRFEQTSLALVFESAYGSRAEGVVIFQNKRYMGKIAPSGSAILKPALSPENKAFLIQLEHAFEATVSDYGKKSGACCFCTRTLTDPESLKRGYGPICAQRYRLQFVAKPEPDFDANDDGEEV